MQTERLKVDPADLQGPASQAAMARAAEILRGGGLVALPTETVYGLAANALDADAVARIFVSKGRPSWDPVIVHVAEPDCGITMLNQVVEEVSPRARLLMETFWPGPLTLLMPRTARVPDAVTAGRPLVGVRMPAHPVAREVIRLAGVPVAAPSANTFGHTSPTMAAHVLDDLDGRIDAVLDAGPAEHGVESTVLDPNQTPMVIYRPGAVTVAQIQQIAGEVESFPQQGPLVDTPRSALASPGLGLRHYAPRARLVLIGAPLQRLGLSIAEAAQELPNERIGIMLPTELGTRLEQASAKARYFAWGRWAAPEELAQRLYAGLRALDSLGCTVILCPVPPAQGIGAAIRDRLIKAAASN